MLVHIVLPWIVHLLNYYNQWGSLPWYHDMALIKVVQNATFQQVAGTLRFLSVSIFLVHPVHTLDDFLTVILTIQYLWSCPFRKEKVFIRISKKIWLILIFDSIFLLVECLEYIFTKKYIRKTVQFGFSWIFHFHSTFIPLSFHTCFWWFEYLLRLADCQIFQKQMCICTLSLSILLDRINEKIRIRMYCILESLQNILLLRNSLFCCIFKWVLKS